MMNMLHYQKRHFIIMNPLTGYLHSFHSVRTTLAFLTTVLVSSGFILTGCHAFRKPNTMLYVDNRPEVAVLTSITRAIPLTEIINDLSPTFEMSPELALKKSIPVTLQEQDYETQYRGISANLQVQGGISPTTTQRDTEINADKLTALAPLIGIVEKNSRLEYRDAYSLYQNIQLLNRTLEDAPEWNEYTTYVVTLQITLMAYVRNMPYDAYTIVSFFSGHSRMCQNSEPDSSHNKKTYTPFVVPLLVTDHMELASQDRTVDRIRSTTLSLGALINVIGLGASWDSFSQHLNKLQSHDYNSLTTDGRLTLNTYMIRLGALHAGTSKYATVPQKHDLTFLLMVPNQYSDGNRTMNYISKTLFRDANTGKLLQQRSRKELDEAIRRWAPPGIKKGVEFNTDKVIELAEHIRCNRAGKFFEDVNDKTKYPEALWVEIAEFFSGDSFSYAPFELSKEKKPTLPKPTNQLVTLAQGKLGWSATIRGGKNLPITGISATLILKNSTESDDSIPKPGEENPNKFGKTVVLPTSIDVDKDRKAILLSFPPVPVEFDPEKIRLDYKYKKICLYTEYHNIYKIENSASHTKRRNLSVRVHQSTIKSDKQGNGRIQLFVTDNGQNRDAGTFFLKIRDAAVNTSRSQENAIIEHNGDVFKVLRTGVVILELSNLVPGHQVFVDIIKRLQFSSETITHALTVH